MTGSILQAGERIDQLYQNDVKVIQNTDVFSYTIDAVLLADFAQVPRQSGLVLDLCAGNGAVGLFVSKKTKAQIIGIEIQERLADMARRSITLNHLEEQLQVITADLKDTLTYIAPSSVDSLVCNPPYFKVADHSKLNDSQYFTLARHEIATDLATILSIAKKVLKTNGHLALVHRPDRLVEILIELAKHNLVPKRIRFVHPKADKPANILLIDAIKDGQSGGEKILPPLVVHEENGDYTPEVNGIYYG